MSSSSSEPTTDRERLMIVAIASMREYLTQVHRTLSFLPTSLDQSYSSSYVSMSNDVDMLLAYEIADEMEVRKT